MKRRMKKIIKSLQSNAVVQFIFSYLLLLIFTFICCTAGFQRAFKIVEGNLIEENGHLMKQSVGQIDELFSDLNDAGMKLASSSALKALGQENSRSQEDYGKVIQTFLREYREVLLYCEDWSGQAFIYVDALDRVIYDSSVYFPRIFEMWLKRWDISEAEWEQLCGGDEKVPYIYTQENGEIIFVFPSRQSIQNATRMGTVFLRMDKNEVLKRMSFLEKYSAYSVFVIQDNQLLAAEDGLGCRLELEDNWLQEEGNYNLDGRLVFNIASEEVRGRNYILVIPQQEAMLNLQELQRHIWLLILTSAAAGIAIALFFSMRSGKPINQLADMLKENNEQITAGNLNSINHTVSEMLQDQKKNQIALQKAFFHNLLKADFLSRAEMEYMAGKVNLQLQGEIYYAAAIRFFPQIDVDSIDGQTLDEVRNLQTLTSGQLESIYSLPVWSYKRNTLVTMYVIEAKEEDAVLEALTDIVIWLRNTWHVDAFWGVGAACDNLMNFWKSAEEAVFALEHNDKEAAVCRYNHISHLEDAYYLPYSVEEHFVKGLRAGDYKAVEDALAFIREENCVRRTISRKQFLKLNRELGDILTELLQGTEGFEDRLIYLSSLLSEKKESEEGYFSCLSLLCCDICELSASQKDKKRNEKMQNILDFMAENYANPGMGLGMVGEHCKLSEGYLSAIFKEEMGVNFADYLEQLRIERACQLLKEGELVALVAEETGYNSVQSFRRAFKRVKGISPSEYRTE